MYFIDYNHFMSRFRLPLALFFFLWIGFVLAALFVTQRPMTLQVVPGLIYVSRSLLLVAVLLANAAGRECWVRAGHRGSQTARHQIADTKIALITIKR